MKHKKPCNSLPAIHTLLLALMAGHGHAEDIGERSDQGIAMLASLQSEQGIIYLNANVWLEQEVITPAQLSERVINQGKRILIDFSAINDQAERQQARKAMELLMGISFETDWVLLSGYKGQLLFTPFAGIDDPAFTQVMEQTEQPVGEDEYHTPLADEPSYDAPSLVQGRSSPPLTAKAERPPPHVAFFINVNHKITDKECTFPVATKLSSEVPISLIERAYTDDKGAAKTADLNSRERVFCKSAHISLVYRVNLLRSLPSGSSGSESPDAKIVRISLEKDSAGAGIQLNEKLNTEETAAKKTVPFGAGVANNYKRFDDRASDLKNHKRLDGRILDGWEGEFATDAIAQDYRFSIEADNETASVLKVHPNNVSTNYKNTEISSFTMGVTGNAAVDIAKAPKLTFGASPSYSYHEARHLSFDTQDYRVEYSALSPQQPSFTWVREQYPTAASLLTYNGSLLQTIKHRNYLDQSRIRPLSYKGFVPNFDVIYYASPDATDKTTFSIKSSVNIRPIYTGVYRHYYGWSHLSYQGLEDTPRNRVEDDHTKFTVNWDHPVFTGARPINLQLGGFNNRCLAVDTSGDLRTEACKETSTAQSFIYDLYGRYVSVQNAGFCLDGSEFNQLQSCNMSLSQRWKWKQDSDVLINLEYEQLLGHDISSGALSLYDEGSKPDNVSTRTLTFETRLFEQY